jgi:hypothetical protein
MAEIEQITAIPQYAIEHKMMSNNDYSSAITMLNGEN